MAINIYFEEMTALPYINIFQSPTKLKKSKLKTKIKEKTKSELMLFVTLAANQSVFLMPPLTVNHLISFQLLLLHMLQYVTPLLTNTWRLLIKDILEINLKSTGSGQSSLCNSM